MRNMRYPIVANLICLLLIACQAAAFGTIESIAAAPVDFVVGRG